MKQGIRALAASVAIALAAGTMAPSFAPLAHAAGSASTAATSKATTTKKKPTVKTYQFTGVIVAVDKSSLTVQKGKAKPTTKVFSKDEKMRVTGDVEKGARVTVYYRNEGSDAVAHRVVVKEGTGSAKEG
jgi:hypothetical protein